MEYLRVKLLTYSDRSSGMLYDDISIDVDNCSMKFISDKNRYVTTVFFGNLDASTIRHNSARNRSEGQLIIMPIVGKNAKITYSESSDDFFPENRVIIFYNAIRLLEEGNTDKARIDKAIKALIVACGGKDTKELF